MHVGVARVVADMLAFEPRPDRRRDDLARLGRDVAEADLLLFLAFSEVAVLAAGGLAQASQALTATSPLVSGASIRIVSQASISLSIFGRPAVGRQDPAIEIAEQLDLMLGVPVEALGPIAELLEQRAPAR